jgi:hypothetical protein
MFRTDAMLLELAVSSSRKLNNGGRQRQEHVIVG